MALYLTDNGLVKPLGLGNLRLCTALFTASRKLKDTLGKFNLDAYDQN